MTLQYGLRERIAAGARGWKKLLSSIFGSAVSLIVFQLSVAGLSTTYAPGALAQTCPPVVVTGETSLEGYAIHQNTHEKVGDTVPAGTPLRVTGDGVAAGYCDIYVWNGASCQFSQRLYRGIVALQLQQTTYDKYFNGFQYGGGTHWNPGPIDSEPNQVFFGGTESPGTAPYAQFENWPGKLRFSLSMNVNEQIPLGCDYEGGDTYQGKDFEVNLVEELRCDVDQEEGIDFWLGNPCDLTTGNKRQVESDYDEIGAGLRLIRTYNSAISIDFGFGPGWITPFHKRIEPFSDTRRVRRGNGYGDLFEDVSGSWEGPDDTDYLLESDATGYDVTLSDGAVERYDLDGRILSETDRVGRTTTYSYDSADRLSSVTGPFGHELSFSYDSNNRVESVTDPSSATINYTYDAEGRLTRVTYQDSTYRDYLYESTSFAFHLTGIIDENGDRYATYSFGAPYTAAVGKAISTEHAQTTNGAPQEKFSFAYNSAHTQVTVTDPASNVWTYNLIKQHDIRKITSRVSQADSKTYTQSFDSDNNLTSKTDEEGRTTNYTYNSSNQRTSKTEAYGTAVERTTTYEYLSADEDLVTKVITDSVDGSSDREVTTTYDSSRNVTQIATTGRTPSGASVSRSITMQYNSAGQVTQINGARTDVSDITTITYNECTTGYGCGQMATITNALGHVTSYDSYDVHGRVLQMTDPNNVVTSYVYDLRGRVTSVTQTPPSGPARVTSYAYDDAGQLETVTAPNGRVLTYVYDEAHDLRSITDNLGNRIEYLYDTSGNQTDEDVRDPSLTLTKTVDYTYDIRNRVESINAAGSVTDLVFDAVGNLTDETDPNSNATAHDYDPLNRLEESLDALNGVTAYDYDINNYLTSVEAPNGATTTYSYDDLGNLLSMSSPDTGTTTYTYDAAGNRLTQTNANSVTTTYTYDALNRLSTISYPETSLNVVFTYDAGTNQKGRLTGMSDASGSTTYAYDVYGNVKQESKTIDSVTHVIDYDWNSANLLESITYPSGRTVDYTRNALGQITAVDTTYDTTNITVANSISYEPFGPLSGLTFGNSLVMDRDYDTQYRLTDQTTGGIQDLTFMHDAAGNIDAIADAVNSSLSQSFSQDALHRIDYESGAYGTKDYTYDAVGNRLTRVHDDGSVVTQTLTYTTNSNRLATHDGNTVTIDSAGNTTADITEDLSFVYDDHNRMVEAYVSSTLEATYTYNGHGQRIKKVEATGDERTYIFHYGLTGQLIGETVYDDVGALVEERDYIWLDTLPVAQSHRVYSDSTITDDVFVYLHTDQLGTPRLATNGSGTIVWRWDSDAFGLGDADTDPDADTNEVSVWLRFPGQYYDEETSLSYNYFRNYDAVTGRYVESDPIGLAGGMNTFKYARANPIPYLDPLGLDAYTVHVGVNIPLVGGVDVGLVFFDDQCTILPDVGGFIQLNKSLGGAAKAKLVSGVSQTVGPRSNFDGVDAEVSVGLGDVGGSVGSTARNGPFPSSVSLEVGPQFGYEENATVTGSITVRDIGRLIARMFHGDGGQIIGESSSCECSE